jgi:uncharacterized RDD family membrane protein YckC
LPPVPGATTLEPTVAYATFWQRVGASLIDALLYIPFLIVPFMQIWNDLDDAARRGGSYQLSYSPFESRYLGWSLATLAASAAYHILMVHYRGQTVGKMAMAIKVVQIEDGGLPSWDRAAIRWAFPTLLSWIQYLGIVAILDYLWMIWDRQSQCLHDKVARTIVIRLR